jgi:hypothetical protein
MSKLSFFNKKISALISSQLFRLEICIFAIMGSFFLGCGKIVLPLTNDAQLSAQGMGNISS